GTPPSACFNTAIICASLYRTFFIVNLLRYLAEKILLLNNTNFRGDYLGTGPQAMRQIESHAAVMGDHLHFEVWGTVEPNTR
ncbi:MAG: hypothetical protein ABJN52_16835, partial [Litorimonas sp.]